jgi:hypothetical protein
MDKKLMEEEISERNYYARLAYRKQKLARNGIEITIEQLREIDKEKNKNLPPE